MASTGNVTLTAALTGAPSGSRTFNTTQTFTAAVDATMVVALLSGNNTILVPTGATCVIITGPNAVSPQPNPSWSGTLALKGSAGDPTGVNISTSQATKIAWDTAPASFVVWASTTGATIEIFFA